MAAGMPISAPDGLLKFPCASPRGAGNLTGEGGDAGQRVNARAPPARRRERQQGDGSAASGRTRLRARGPVRVVGGDFNGKRRFRHGMRRIPRVGVVREPSATCTPNGRSRGGRCGRGGRAVGCGSDGRTQSFARVAQRAPSCSTIPSRTRASRGTERRATPANTDPAEPRRSPESRGALPKAGCGGQRWPVRRVRPDPAERSERRLATHMG